MLPAYQAIHFTHFDFVPFHLYMEPSNFPASNLLRVFLSFQFDHREPRPETRKETFVTESPTMRWVAPGIGREVVGNDDIQFPTPLQDPSKLTLQGPEIGPVFENVGRPNHVKRLILERKSRVHVPDHVAGAGDVEVHPPLLVSEIVTTTETKLHF